MMMKTGFALILALAAGGAARAEEPLRWQLRQSADGVVLAYEQPETDFQPIYLGCRLPERRFTVSLEQARGVRPGQTAAVDFASEAGRVTLRMRLEQMEMGDFLTAEMPFDPALGRVLGEGRSLRITVGQRTDTYPLTGTRQGVAALAAACGPR